MLILSLIAAVQFVPTPIPSPVLTRPPVPTLDSEARRMGVPSLTLRRALRGTSKRHGAYPDDPLYCIADNLSVPGVTRRVCHTRTQWQNAGFEPEEINRPR